MPDINTPADSTGWWVNEYGGPNTRYWAVMKDGTVQPSWGHKPKNTVPARDAAIKAHLEQHLAANPDVYKSEVLEKAWPKDPAENAANTMASLAHPVIQDKVLEETGANKEVLEPAPYAEPKLHNETAVAMGKLTGGKSRYASKARQLTPENAAANPQTPAQLKANDRRRFAAETHGRQQNWDQGRYAPSSTGPDGGVFAEEVQNQFPIPDLDLPHQATFAWEYLPTLLATGAPQVPDSTDWAVQEFGGPTPRYWGVKKNGTVDPLHSYSNPIGTQPTVPGRDAAIKAHLEQHLAANPDVYKSELMPGGKGDSKPDSDFDAGQLKTGIAQEMEEHGLDEARAREIAKDHLTEDPRYYSMEKAALEAGKTGRHQVVLPVGAQIDPGPSTNHEAGKLKIRSPDTGKTKWRSVRAGVVMAPDGTPTSSRNPSGS